MDISYRNIKNLFFTKQSGLNKLFNTPNQIELEHDYWLKRFIDTRDPLSLFSKRPGYFGSRLGVTVYTRYCHFKPVFRRNLTCSSVVFIVEIITILID